MSIKRFLELLSKPIISLGRKDRQDLQDIVSNRELLTDISRRQVLKTGGLIVGASALLAATESEAEAAASTSITLAIDLVTDGRTFSGSSGLGPMVGKKGDGFVVQGGLFMGNSVSTSTMPDASGRLGTWNCFGIFNVDGPDTGKPGPVPPFLSTQLFLLNSGDQITTSGGEFNLPTTTRSIIGGTGIYLGVTGLQEGTPLGANPTGAPTARFTLRMIKPKVPKK